MNPVPKMLFLRQVDDGRTGFQSALRRLFETTWRCKTVFCSHTVALVNLPATPFEFIQAKSPSAKQDMYSNPACDTCPWLRSRGMFRSVLAWFLLVDA